MVSEDIARFKIWKIDFSSLLHDYRLIISIFMHHSVMDVDYFYFLILESVIVTEGTFLDLKCRSRSLRTNSLLLCVILNFHVQKYI